MVLHLGLRCHKPPSQNIQWFIFLEIQQKKQQATKEGDDGERFKNYWKRLVEKMDAAQTKVTHQGTTQPYTRRRFIIAFPLLLLF